MRIHNVLHRSRIHRGKILWRSVFAIGLLLPGWVQADPLASVLPGKRVVQVGDTATAFASMVNTGSTLATDCSIALATTVDATFLYQTTDPATNALTGTANTPVNIAAGAIQTYLFAFTPNSAFPQTGITLTFDCTNTAPAPAGVVNAFSLGASATPVPDIIALAATTQSDGIAHLPTTDPDTGVFSVASVNVGAPGMVDVTGDTGAAMLPVTISVCETNPLTGACINPAVPSGNSLRQYETNDTATHSFFIDPSDTVALDPGNNRAFANFQGVSNAAQGVTSVAVEGGMAASGGGGSGSNGPFGGLVIAGADTGAIGTTFEPLLGSGGTTQPLTSVSWAGFNNVIPNGLAAFAIASNNGVPSNLGLDITSSTDPSLVYSYSLLCAIMQSECNKVSLDLVNKTLTLNNVVVPVMSLVAEPENDATGSVTLNGTLTW